MANTTPTALAAAQPSPDGTAIQVGGTLTDFSGNTYSLISGQDAEGGNVLVDGGSSDSTTASLLVYVHSLVFELTSTDTWRVVNKADTSSAWETVNGDPRGTSPPLTPDGE